MGHKVEEIPRRGQVSLALKAGEQGTASSFLHLQTRKRKPADGECPPWGAQSLRGEAVRLPVQCSVFCTNLQSNALSSVPTYCIDFISETGPDAWSATDQRRARLRPLFLSFASNPQTMQTCTFSTSLPSFTFPPLKQKNWEAREGRAIDLSV